MVYLCQSVGASVNDEANGVGSGAAIVAADGSRTFVVRSSEAGSTSRTIVILSPGNNTNNSEEQQQSTTDNRADADTINWQQYRTGHSSKLCTFLQRYYKRSKILHR